MKKLLLCLCTLAALLFAVAPSADAQYYHRRYRHQYRRPYHRPYHRHYHRPYNRY